MRLFPPDYLIELMGEVGVLVVLAIIGWAVVRRYRDRADGNSSIEELSRNVREMRRRGDLSDREYRTIMTALDEIARDKSNDAGEPT